uniref:Cullin-4 n=1 Tax=Mucochytrium quahogii TaxID=96639 RepID=A0A7S2RUN5_9STRA|mmetsp:Transcript_7002/g.11113  ORF Transcript_7002/g.11113 Transcript_7002/m.11113 type:complete len:741 (-) Transcript_7002:501-2723(-)
MIGSSARSKISDRGTGKRMKIRLSKANPKLPEHFLDKSWVKLEEAVNAIHKAEPVTHSREELYHVVEDLCMHKQAAELCKRLEGLLDKRIEQSIASLIDQTPDHAAFLSLVSETWQNHCQQMQSIRSIFLYLDRSYIISDLNLRSLWEIGLGMFRKYLEKEPQVEEKVISGFLDLIARERNGEDVNYSICTCIVRMLVALQLYEEKFEARFLQETCDFYKQESVRIFQQSLVPDYLLHVEQRLKEEKKRVTQYLDPQTRSQLVKVCEKELILTHVSILLEKGFETLMDARRTADLQRMYTLFARVDSLNNMRVTLSAYVKRRGLEVVKNEAEEKEMVPTLLRLKQDLDDLLANAMSNNEDFERTIRDAFEAFINSRENRPAELIAKYIDRQLRSGSKGVSGEEEVETLLDKVVVLFRFLNAKDVFEAFYKKDLAKRLLLGKSASNDLERSMIAKLKTECGSNFTNKLEGMFKDIGISKDLMVHFNNSEKVKDQKGNMEIHVSVLTTGFWPAYPSMKSLKLPVELATYQTLFSDYYLSKYNGRRLAWQHSLGHCLLGANLPAGRRELQVSLFQTVVLMIFNQATSAEQEMPFAFIKTASGIEDAELRRTLQSLACGKIRVLSKLPPGRDIGDNDKFVISKECKPKQFRVKINSIQMKESSKENAETHEKVFQDRQYQVDAAIVRVMKARKTLTHTLLLAELFKQLRFKAKPVDLKRRIESLIDREYLERDEGDPNIYNYLA